MLDSLFKKFIRIQNRRDLVFKLKSRYYKLVGINDINKRYELVRKSKYLNKLENKLYLMKEPIRAALLKNKYYIPYDIVGGVREYGIKRNIGDKKKVLEIYTDLRYLDSYILYQELSYEALSGFLSKEYISKIIINPTSSNVVMSQGALQKRPSIIINKNKLKLEAR